MKETHNTHTCALGALVVVSGPICSLPILPPPPPSPRSSTHNTRHSRSCARCVVCLTRCSNAPTLTLIHHHRMVLMRVILPRPAPLPLSHPLSVKRRRRAPVLLAPSSVQPGYCTLIPTPSTHSTTNHKVSSFIPNSLHHVITSGRRLRLLLYQYILPLTSPVGRRTSEY